MVVYACDVGGSFAAHLTAEQKLNPPKADWYGCSVSVLHLRRPTVLGVKEMKILDRINPGWDKKKRPKVNRFGAVVDSGA